MNDAANSLYEANPADAYPVIEWIKRTGASVDETLAAWKDGRLAELPVGRAWDVVRIPTFEGWEVVRQLCALRVALGPVLHTQLGVEVLVPVGSAEDWDCPGSTVLIVGDTIDVPHPRSSLRTRRTQGRGSVPRVVNRPSPMPLTCTALTCPPRRR